MARYKKEVKLSQIGTEVNKVRKRFGNIVVFEMNTGREQKIIEKIIEISSMDIPKEKKEILNLHASLTIFTNIRVDVDDENFIKIMADMPSDLKLAIFEVQSMLSDGSLRMKKNIENMMKSAQLAHALKEVGVDD